MTTGESVMTAATTEASDLAQRSASRGTFAIGFKGNTLDEVLPWAIEQVGEVSSKVVVAMAGSGKDIAALARPGRLIVSWDPQELSRLVVEGIFSQPPGRPVPLERGEAFGWCHEHRPISGMPEDAVRLVDWIAIAGEDFDRACLAWAFIRATFQGRLASWSRGATADTLWTAYLRAHEKLAKWRGLPGKFQHVHGSVFDDPELPAKLNRSTLFIDTPKVFKVSSKRESDIYSAGWSGLNSVLAQSTQVLPPWTASTYLRDMPKLWRGSWDRMLLFHTNDALPSMATIEAAMHTDDVPDPTEKKAWFHGPRADLCLVVDR